MCRLQNAFTQVIQVWPYPVIKAGHSVLAMMRASEPQHGLNVTAMPELIVDILPTLFTPALVTVLNLVVWERLTLMVEKATDDGMMHGLSFASMFAVPWYLTHKLICCLLDSLFVRQV